MRFFQTLRFKLTILYLLFIVVPFVISAFALPSYIKGMLMRETQKLTISTMNAVSKNIETYLDDLVRLSTMPYLNDDLMSALKIKANNTYETANDYIKLTTDRALKGTLPQYLTNTRPDILSTLIVPVKGQAYLTSKGSISLKPDFIFHTQDWYQQAYNGDGQAVFISSHPQDYLNLESVPQAFSVARLIKDPDTRRPLAVIMADADKKVLEKIASDVDFNVSSIVVILDQSGNTLYANQTVPEELKEQLSSFRQKDQYESNNYLGISKKISPADWRIVVFLSNQEKKDQVRWIYIVALLLTAAALLVTFGVLIYFTRWIVKPFKRMNHVMHKVKRGDLSERYTLPGNDEIAQLGHSLNSMVSRLDELINQEYLAKLAQQDAEYRALQSQIQPHFLYNTLNGFIGLNREGRAKELETAIISLSYMMRYSLEPVHETTLEKELDILRKYCMLQQLRFDDRLAFQIDCDPDAASFPIPKLLLQPLVENCIIHGVEPADKEMVSVSVRARRRERDSQDYIEIVVKDDGVGFDPSASNSEDQIGLSNVRTRLTMSYPDAVMEVESRPGAGTTISIYIPTKEYSL
jgi:two-component system, sensor histidine kinase YesM